MKRNDMIKSYLYFILLFVIINISSRISVMAMNGIVALSLSAIWVVVTIALYFICIKKNSKTMPIIFYSLSNAILGGIAISAYYSLKNVAPLSMVALVVVFGGLMLINYVLINVVKRKTIFTGINVIVSIIIMIASAYLWIMKDQSLGSSLTFQAVIYLCFSIALHFVVKKSYEWVRIIPIASLLMFGGLLLVAIIAITEGDGIDAIDIDFPINRKGKKPSNISR